MEDGARDAERWDGYVDWRNRPATRARHGGMLAASFVLVVEVLENLAFLANASNLVTYLMGFMHYSPSQSATTVTNFMGTAFLLALLGGFLSDAFFTTYTIYIVSAFIEFMIQSAINEGRLNLSEMQVDKRPFPNNNMAVNTMDLQDAKMLVRPDNAEAAKGKNVIVGEPRTVTVNDKVLGREVKAMKTPDGKKTFTITVKNSGSEGQSSSQARDQRPSVAADQDRPVRPVAHTGQTGPAIRPVRTFLPKRPEVGTWKINQAKDQGKTFKPKATFDQVMAKHTQNMAGQKDRPLKRNGSPPRGPPMFKAPRGPWGQGPSLYHGAGPSRPWRPSPPPEPQPIWRDGVMWVPYVPTPDQRGPGFPVYNRGVPPHARPMGPPQRPAFVPRQHGPVRPVYPTGQTGYQQPGKEPAKQEYRPVPKKAEPVPDAPKPVLKDTIQIGSMAVDPNMADGPSVFGASAAKKTPLPQYTQPKWCPPGLSHSQKRRLQRLRTQKLKEEESAKKREEWFNEAKPMIPSTGQSSKDASGSKQAEVPAGKEPNAPNSADKAETGQTGLPDRSDRSPVVPAPAVGTGQTDPEPVRPVSSVQFMAESSSSARVSIPPSVVSRIQEGDDDDAVDSSERVDMEVNVIYMNADYCFIGDDERVAQVDFAPKNAVFSKPLESDNHLKALYVKGHIKGKPVSRMLVDGGAIVNLMPYSLYKKLGGLDGELVKTSMTISGVGGGEPMSAKGVASLELTIGSKTLATAFFVTEVQGNFSVILGRDWIHANQCVPSTLHQCLIQWVGDEVELVQADSSACIAMADASILGTYDNVRCLTGIDISDFEFLTCTRDGFVSAALRPVQKSVDSDEE